MATMRIMARERAAIAAVRNAFWRLARSVASMSTASGSAERVEVGARSALSFSLGPGEERCAPR